MSVNSGYTKYKKHIKNSDGTYSLCSYWTSSNTVHFDDGNTAETNLGAIKGISSSLASTSDNYALSTSAGKSLQDQITTLNSNLETYDKTELNDYAVIRHKNKECILSLELCPLTNGIVSVSLPKEFIPGYIPTAVARIKGISGNYFLGVLSITPNDGLVKCSVMTTYPTSSVSYDGNGVVDGELIYFVN